jgi:hypothetical protein
VVVCWCVMCHANPTHTITLYSLRGVVCSGHYHDCASKPLIAREQLILKETNSNRHVRLQTSLPQLQPPSVEKPYWNRKAVNQMNTHKDTQNTHRNTHTHTHTHTQDEHTSTCGSGGAATCAQITPLRRKPASAAASSSSTPSGRPSTQ